MTIKSVRVLSLGKILGSIYGGLGLIFGVVLAVVSLLGLGPVADGADTPAVLGILLGGGAVVALPLLYGLFGFIGGLVVGTIYNFVAGFVGGIEIEVS
jgi:hypothetical protein